MGRTRHKLFVFFAQHNFIRVLFKCLDVHVRIHTVGCVHGLIVVHRLNDNGFRS